MKYFLLCIGIFLFPITVFAKIEISAIFPDPENHNEEFVEIINTACEDVSLADFLLSNNTKTYIFGEKNLSKWEKLKIFRPESKLILNNAWDNIVLSFGNEKIAEQSYEKKDVKKWQILEYSYEIENCSEENNEDNENETTEESNFQLQKILFLQKENDDFFSNITFIFSKKISEILEGKNIFFTRNNENGEEEIFELISEISLVDGDLQMSIDKEKIQLNEENIKNFFLKWELRLKIEDNEEKFVVPEDIFRETEIEIIYEETEQTDEKNENNEKENQENESENSHNQNSEENFPIIIPELQRATDAILEGNTLYCQEKNCRINLNFEKIFSEKFPKSNYRCEIFVQKEKFDGCNPSQIILTESENIIFIVTQKEKQISHTEIFDVNFSRLLTEKPKTSNVDEKTFSPPVIIIDSDGKYEDEYEWKNENEISCFHTPCLINLSASATNGEKNFPLKYAWQFDWHAEKYGKNPPAVSYETWKHRIVLVAKDSTGMTIYRELLVNVPENQKITNTEKRTKNTEKIEEEFVFIEPEIIIQGNKNVVEIEEYVFECETKNEECSVNFWLLNASKNMRFYWGWNNEVMFESSNPKAKILPIGEHILIIQWAKKWDEDNILYEKKVIVSVKQIEKISVKKSPKVTVKKAKKSPKKTPKPEEKIKENTKISEEKPTEILLPREKNFPVSEVSMMSMFALGAGFMRLRRKEEGF